MTFTTREATPLDAAAITELTRAAYARWVPLLGREPLPMGVDYAAALAEHRIDLFFDDGALVGLIETEVQAAGLYVVNVAVAPALQGQGRGVGAHMLAHAEALARAAGLPRMTLQTNQMMEANVRLYRRLGWRITAELPFRGQIAVHMEKRLAAEARRLLFLPGAGASPAFWRPLGDLLPDAWDKTYLGWPGLGDEPPDPSVRGFADLIRRVEETLEAGPADLLAQSMGVLIALKVALARPQAVRSLVLTVGSGGVDARAHGAVDWRKTYYEAHPHAAPWLCEVETDISGQLGEVRQPCLLVWGDADPISPVAVGETLAERLPNASLRIIPRGEHDLVNRRPAEVAGLVLAHLSGVPA